MAEERKHLGNFEKIFDAIKSSYEGLQGDQSGLDYIGHAMGHLETAADLDEKYSDVWKQYPIVIMFLRMQQHTLRNELRLLRI